MFDRIFDSLNYHREKRTMKHVVGQRGRWLALLAAALLAFGSAGCAEEVGDIDRTQSDKLEKKNLGGVWYYLQTMIDVPQQSANGFIGNTNFGNNAKVMFDIQEHFVYVLPVVETVQFAEAKYHKRKIRNYWDETKAGEFVEVYVGQPIAAFPVTSHFDVMRDYNPSTGKQTNVLVENATDRPWYQRKYIRVDWGKNAIMDWAFPLGTTQFSPVDHYVSEAEDPYLQEAGRGANPDLPEFTGDYIAFVTKAYTPPSGTDWQGQTCNPYGISNKDCAGTIIRVRHSFKQAKPTMDYETFVYTNSEHMDKFGFFLADRHAYDDLWNLTESGRDYKAQRWNLWQTVYDFQDLVKDGQPVMVSCMHDRDCTSEAISAAVSPEFAAEAFGKVLDYTAIKCFKEQHFVAGTCKQATLKPFAQRGLRPIIYHMSATIDEHVRERFYETANQWSKVFKETVAQLLTLEKYDQYWTTSCKTNADCVADRLGKDVLYDQDVAFPKRMEAKAQAPACETDDDCASSNYKTCTNGVCHWKAESCQNSGSCEPLFPVAAVKVFGGGVKCAADTDCGADQFCHGTTGECRWSSGYFVQNCPVGGEATCPLVGAVASGGTCYLPTFCGPNAPCAAGQVCAPYFGDAAPNCPVMACFQADAEGKKTTGIFTPAEVAGLTAATAVLYEDGGKIDVLKVNDLYLNDPKYTERPLALQHGNDEFFIRLVNAAPGSGAVKLMATEPVLEDAATRAWKIDTNDKPVMESREIVPETSFNKDTWTQQAYIATVERQYSAAGDALASKLEKTIQVYEGGQKVLETKFLFQARYAYNAVYIKGDGGPQLVITGTRVSSDNGIRFVNALPGIGKDGVDVGLSGVPAATGLAFGGVSKRLPSRFDKERITVLTPGADGDISCYQTLHEGRCVGWRSNLPASYQTDYEATLKNLPEMFVMCENQYDAAGAAAKMADAAAKTAAGEHAYHDGYVATEGRNPYAADGQGDVLPGQIFNPCEHFVPEPTKMKKIGDVRYNYMYWVGENQAASPLGYGPSAGDPETGELFWATAYVYGAPTITYGQYAKDLVDLINGDIKSEDVITGEYVRQFVAAQGDPLPADNSGTLYSGLGAGDFSKFGAVPSPESLLKMKEVTPFDQSGRLTTRYTDPLLGKPELVDFLFDPSYRKKLLNERLPTVPTGTTQARLDLIRGTYLEDLMITNEVRMGLTGGALTGDEPLDEAMRGQLSPVSWASAAAHTHRRDADRLALAKAPCVFGRDFVDDNVFGIAKEFFCTDVEYQEFLAGSGTKSCLRGDELRWELTRRIFGGVLEHEVGHTVGLRHNFSGSVDLYNFFDNYFTIRQPEKIYCQPTDNDPTGQSFCDEGKNESCTFVAPSTSNPTQGGCYRNSDCPAQTGCMVPQGQDRGTCMSGLKSCSAQNPCGLGYQCQTPTDETEGVCVDGVRVCTTAADCPVGMTCDGTGLCRGDTPVKTGLCSVTLACSDHTGCTGALGADAFCGFQTCASDQQCGPGQTCGYNPECRQTTTQGCSRDSDCATGFTCDQVGENRYCRGPMETCCVGQDNGAPAGTCKVAWKGKAGKPVASQFMTHQESVTKFVPRPIMTDAERTQKMSEYQYSTVMDYGRGFNSDIHGLGKYDYAAIKFGYGRLVEVFKDTSKMQQRIKTLAKYYNRPESYWANAFSTDYWRYAGATFSPFDQLENTIGVAENLQRLTVPYERVKLEHAMQDNSNDNEINWTYVMVPYRFCSDEFRGNLGCYTWDAGVDVGEMVQNSLNSLNEFYIMDAFKRDRLFSGTDSFVGGYFARILDRYMNVLADAGRYFAIYDNIYRFFPWYDDYKRNVYGMLTLSKASRTAFNHLAQMLAAPAPGAYGSDVIACGHENGTVFRACAAGMACETIAGQVGMFCVPTDATEKTAFLAKLNGPVVYRNLSYDIFDANAELVVPVGIGKFPYTQWMSSDQYGFQDHVIYVGSFWTKLAALLTLTDSTFYSASDWVGEQLEIGRSSAVGFNTLYQREMTNLIGGIVANQLDAYSGVVQTDAATGKSVFVARDLFDGGRDAGRPVVEPGLNTLSMKLFASVYGLANLPAGFDPSFTDSMAVFIEGSGNEFDLVTGPGGVAASKFADPFGLKTYIAYEPGYDSAKQRLPAAARIVERANVLKAQWKAAAGPEKERLAKQLKEQIEILDILRRLHTIYGNLLY